MEGLRGCVTKTTDNKDVSHGKTRLNLLLHRASNRGAFRSRENARNASLQTQKWCRNEGKQSVWTRFADMDLSENKECNDGGKSVVYCSEVDKGG